MLPSTWHPRPRHGTLDPRPSTLDKKIDSKVQWYTDNQKVTHIINRGSTKPELQTLAEEIVNLCNHHRVSVIPIWVPRDNNHFTDYLSNLTDVNDWGIHSDIYQWLNTLWGPFTVDRFATCTTLNGVYLYVESRGSRVPCRR